MPLLFIFICVIRFAQRIRKHQRGSASVRQFSEQCSRCQGFSTSLIKRSGLDSRSAVGFDLGSSFCTRCKPPCRVVKLAHAHGIKVARRGSSLVGGMQEFVDPKLFLYMIVPRGTTLS